VFQVVVLPPAEAMRDVEEFRRLHDPAFHRVTAHLPLLPPFDATDAALLERFDAFRGGAGFDVELGPPTAVGRALCLPAARGDAELRALQSALAAALLPSPAEPPRAAPTLRVGLFGGDAELELARRALATLPPPAFAVSEVALLLEDVRGLWHEVRTSKLRARAG